MKKFVIPPLILFLFSACKNETKKVTTHKSYSVCLVNQNYPYLKSPYPGIHANEYNMRGYLVQVQQRLLYQDGTH